MLEARSKTIGLQFSTAKSTSPNVSVENTINLSAVVAVNILKIRHIKKLHAFRYSKLQMHADHFLKYLIFCSLK